jgi:hypothetical protein
MQAPAKTKIYETELLNCWFDEHGILVSDSKSVEKSIHHYDQLFELYDQLSEKGTKKLCTLGNISKSQQLTKPVRDYINGQLPKYIKAMALVSESSVGKTVGNFFILLSSPKYPTRIFSNKEDAISWLKQYL